MFKMWLLSLPVPVNFCHSWPVKMRVVSECEVEKKKYTVDVIAEEPYTEHPQNVLIYDN